MTTDHFEGDGVEIAPNQFVDLLPRELWDKIFDPNLITITEWLGRITYRPNVRLEASRVTSASSELFPVNVTNIHIIAEVEDTYNRGKTITTRAMFPYPDSYMEWGFEHFVRTVRQFLHSWEEHESDEWLLIDGERKFDPHRVKW